MGDEGPADAPTVETPASKKRARDAGDLKRVAEIVMVLSAMGQMRGGKEPTAAERALVAEARQRLVGMCEAVKPKELFSREAVRVVVEDLGLNRSKDPVLGFRPPKMSISEKLLLTKKKMEEPKENHMHSSVYSPQQFPVSFGGRSEPHGTLAHDASRFMQDKSPMQASAGGFQSGSALSHVSVLTSAASSFKPSHISDVQGGANSAKQSSIFLEKASPSAHVGLSARPSGPPYLTQEQAENVTQKIPTISSAQSTSTPVAKFGQPNKLLDHNTVKSENTPGLNAVQSSQNARNHEIKPSTVQAGRGGLHMQSPQGLTFVHTPALFTNHNDIAKSVQKILQANLSDQPSWTPPSTDYMSTALNCQICKNAIMDIESLLVCDVCEKGNHLKCLQSYGNKNVPKAEWHCPRCLASSNGKPLPPKYGRVTRAPVGAPKAAPGASTQAASKRTEDLDSKVNQQTALANGNASLTQHAHPSNFAGNFGESVPDSTSVEANLTPTGVKRDTEPCNSVGASHLKERSAVACTTSDTHLLNRDGLFDDNFASGNTKSTSETVLQPSTLQGNSCDHSQSMLVENNHFPKTPFTQDMDQLKLSSNVEASANHLHENTKCMASEPEEALAEKKLPESVDSCSVKLASEDSSQATTDETNESFQLATT
ncbi:hypothetical protein Cni_G22721 [Canna indica]|uniref:PHD-type domain-containing protein n=1 Tax=Canna indica TaxID=4628 RepID=A0AAQ3QIJ4_9LILI|nr:hypothetical protein Cni_G22721 [Canna indica]